MNYLERKKRAIISTLDVTRGITRTVEGDNKIILTDCVDDYSLKSIKLYGKTVDIPTDYYVYRTRNDEVIPSGTMCYFTIEGVNYSFTTSEEIPVLTLFKYCISTGETVMVKDDLDTIVTTEIVTDVTGMTKIPMSNEKNPDNPYELKSITNPVITVKGKNLFNVDADFSNVIKSKDNYYNHEIQLKPYTTYSVSLTENMKDKYIILCIGGMYGFHSSGRWISHKAGGSLCLNPGNSAKFTTTDTGKVYLAMATYSDYHSVFTSSIKGFQLEEGDTATEFEPYRVPQTVTLPDITLNGFISYNSNDIVTSTDVGYFDDIGTQYWADSIILKDNKVYLRTNVSCGVVNGTNYTTDMRGSVANAQHYMTGKYRGLLTYIKLDGVEQRISGCMSSHFKTLFSKTVIRYGYVPINYNDFGCITGGRSGEYAWFDAYVIPKNALGEDETFTTYLQNLGASGSLISVMARSTLETDITDTEAGQALLSLHSYKGNTIIETDGHLSAEYLSNTEE